MEVTHLFNKILIFVGLKEEIGGIYIMLYFFVNTNLQVIIFKNLINIIRGVA